jgi:exopolyphosphatase/pppGpp-phosphohydrolase
VTRRVAAVDCGTNSLRLLLADVDPGQAGLTDVVRRMEIVRLGQGVDQTGRLAPEALARTMTVLREYADVIARSGAQAVRMVATSATRDADNAAEFVRLVKEVLGVAPEVLTGDEEAVLSFTVAAAVPARDARTLIGLAGSVTTIAAIAMGLPAYDAARIHHARVAAADVHAVTCRLLSQTRAERAAIGVMHPGRADVIGGGALVLDRLMQRFGFAGVLVSEHDILDGMAWSLAGDSPG